MFKIVVAEFTFTSLSSCQVEEKSFSKKLQSVGTEREGKNEGFHSVFIDYSSQAETLDFSTA